MSFHMGNGGKVVKSGGSTTAINVHGWTIKKTSKLSDTTHSGTAGWQGRIGTVKGVSGTFRAPWDDAAEPHGLGIEEGTEWVGQFYIGDTPHYWSGQLVVAEVEYESNSQEGHVIYVVSFESDGVWTYT